MPRTRFLYLWALLFTVACGSGAGGCSTGCAGFTSKPQGSFTGDKLDSAAAVRVTQKGFAVLNASAPQLLSLFADGGVITGQIPCTVAPVAFGIAFALGDTGSAGCTDETCGRGDGKCDARDVGSTLSIALNGVTFASKSPDVIEATLSTTVKTGVVPFSEAQSSILCLFNGRAKCSVELDSSLKPPATNEISLDVHLTIDPRWDKLLTLTVAAADLGGTKACGTPGASPGPACLDPADMLIADEPGSCGVCGAANLAFLKTVLISALSTVLSTQIPGLLKNANCARCGPAGACPQTSLASSSCQADGGVCVDTLTGACVPGLIGIEGELDVSQLLGALGPSGSAPIALELGLGGAVASSTAGLTVGARGGAKELTVASCVAPVARPLPPALPLPDFDLDAPGAYDLGFSLSQQFLTEALLRAEQSGALCLDLTTASVAVLTSSSLATLVPSLNVLTHGDDVAMRLVLRPQHPPTAAIGAGTIDATGKILDPLLRLGWQGLQLDLYATIEDREVRLFTLSADLSLPLGLSSDGCSGLTPVIGGVSGLLTNLSILNSELLAESPASLQALFPSLLALAEPQLATALSKVTLPAVQGFTVQVIGTRGVGAIAGTSQFNHLGVYANLLAAGTACTPKAPRLAREPARLMSHAGALAILDTGTAQTPFSWRVDGGLWSTFRPSDLQGRLLVEHPRLLLGGGHLVEVRTEQGTVHSIAVP